MLEMFLAYSAGVFTSVVVALYWALPEKPKVETADRAAERARRREVYSQLYKRESRND